jgi:ADP-dependent phosphofructokinase/glucokinase
MTTSRWHTRYADLAAELVEQAPGAGPFVFGFNVCVDQVWSVDAGMLRRIAAAARAARPTPGPAQRLCAEVLDRITAGRGGEIFCDWADGPAWLSSLLPEPDRRQVGGTGPQAAWTLAELGTRCILPLADRSPAQLSVLHPRIEVVANGALVPVRELEPHPAADEAPGKPYHGILEFSAGTAYPGGVLPRSTRIILRFAADGIECDQDFTNLQPRFLPSVTGAVVSGMNGIAPDGKASWAWLESILDDWAEAAVPHIHVELADYPSLAELQAAAALGAVRAESLGVSLSELRTISGSGTPEPGPAAIALAEKHGYQVVVVHADEWSLAVHRGDPATIERRLMTGNLLASVRAAAGSPQSRPAIPPGAVLVDDHPRPGPIGDGWQQTCVPSPWLRTPRSTIGLGDSFVAGFQLGASGGRPIDLSAPHQHHQTPPQGVL